jgi:DAHP synthetase I family
MQNYHLLRALGKLRRPVLLKRGSSTTIEELLLSAKYVMAGGNYNVVLCERGIRTFETATRNTLDIAAIPVIKKLSHLPILRTARAGATRSRPWATLRWPRARMACSSKCTKILSTPCRTVHSPSTTTNLPTLWLNSENGSGRNVSGRQVGTDAGGSPITSCGREALGQPACLNRWIPSSQAPYHNS